MEEPDRIPLEESGEREGPGSGTEDELPDIPGDDLSPEPAPDEKDDEQIDREADETFPASDPPANY